jgi:hypothetical protein
MKKRCRKDTEGGKVQKLKRERFVREERDA